MTVFITPLIGLNETADYVPTPEVIDLVRLNVPVYVTTAEQAIEALIALGRPEDEATRHVEYCLSGRWVGP